MLPSSVTATQIGRDAGLNPANQSSRESTVTGSVSAVAMCPGIEAL
jgi:hypothetical protein